MISKLFVLACLLAVSHSRYVNVNQLSVKPRIFGGRNATIGEFPYQVSIQRGSPPSQQHFCGGVILNDKWILTAAHCVKSAEETGLESIVVKAGKYDLTKFESNEQVAFIEKSFKHPISLGGGIIAPGDIALIKLTTSLELNKYVATAKLPEAGSDPIGNVIVSGWGATGYVKNMSEIQYPDILKTVTVPVLDRGVCNKAIKDVLAEMNIEVTEDIVDITTICTGPLTRHISVCSGDSGGPLVQRNQNHELEVVGIVSWAYSPCGYPGLPTGFFVRVGSFINWLNDTMNEN